MTPHILVIADGRSPTTKSWIGHIQTMGFTVSLISTFACTPLNNLAHFHVLPLAFSHVSAKDSGAKKKSPQNQLKSIIRRFLPIFQRLRYFFGPLTLIRYSGRYKHLVHKIQPDLIHALRIPFEGMLASYTPQGYPLIAATWGNDLTLHAKGSFLMDKYTRRCLQRADGLTSDTHRDIRLAHTWGLKKTALTLVVPGSGGIDIKAIQLANSFNPEKFDIPRSNLWVVNPRGLRPGSVYQDVFFAAIPKVLSKLPETIFICPGMANAKQATTWINEFKIQQNTFLLTKLSQSELWSLFKSSSVFVSPSSHDGTPNTLLEAMACGCFPVVGDIESMHEWIEHGTNGFLVNPRDPNQLANAIITALGKESLQKAAATQNLSIIEKRAAQNVTRPNIQHFYSQFLA